MPCYSVRNIYRSFGTQCDIGGHHEACRGVYSGWTCALVLRRLQSGAMRLTGAFVRLKDKVQKL